MNHATDNLILPECYIDTNLIEALRNVRQNSYPINEDLSYRRRLLVLKKLKYYYEIFILVS